MKHKILPGPSGFLLLLLLPYLSTLLLNGMETALLNRKFDREMLLPVIVASQISADCEPETVKAQAVIARSNFDRRMDNGEKISELIRDAVKIFHPTAFIFRIPASVCEKAVSETRGEILTVNGEAKPAPYHVCSAGKTRDGKEVLHSDAYSYLKSVDSSADKESPDYLSSVYTEPRRLPKDFSIKKRDSAGYVTEILADGKTLEGEAFREGLGLASANFSIHKVGEQYRFLSRGRGHGLGFSQYGGNRLAKEGSTYREILEIYFPEMEIQKCE